MSKDLTNSASVAQINKRLCFSIPARPLSVDVSILDLEPDTEILISTSLAGLSGLAACKAKVAIEEIERTIKRQGMDYYTMREIAEIMAAAHNLDACDFLKTRMHPAYKSGVLKLLDPKDGGFVKERQCDDLNDWVTPANLDKWLEIEFEYRWPVAVPVAIAKRNEKKPSIETVALDYMRAEFKQAQFQSASKFHKHLIKTAGLNTSPFEMGTGINARKLFCSVAGSFFNEGTLGKMWAKIRAV